MSTKKNFHVGKKMNSFLKPAGFTTEQIAKVLSIGKVTWFNIIKAEHPNLKYVQAFCKALKIDFEKEFASEYEHELNNLSIVQEAQEPYGNSKLKEMSEELHTAYRKLTLSYEREMKMMRLLAQNQISIPE